MKLRRTTRAQRDLERIVSYISDVEQSKDCFIRTRTNRARIRND